MTTLPAVTADQMTVIDALMASRYAVQPIQLMEVAGQAVARAVRLAHRDIVDGHGCVSVLAGTGGNGGDALVAARFLHGWGVHVRIVLSKPAAHVSGLVAAHLKSAQALGIAVTEGLDPIQTDLVIDGLLGFSTTRPPTGRTEELIAAANRWQGPILAIDIPSGLNATTGEPYSPTIRATTTLTLGLPKTGLLAAPAASHLGALLVADIGIPPHAYLNVGLTVSPTLFANGDLIALHNEGAPLGH